LSDYTKSTNFATKDNLSSGNPLKIVKGTEIDTEFNNIATAVATKADLASPTFTGTPTLPTGTIAVTQSSGSNTTTIATTAFVQAAIALLYPVGSIYTNATSSTNAGTLLGFGTWTAFGAGRVPVGFDSSNALFDSAEETGGSADAITVSHTHTATFTGTAMGTHRHNVGSNDSTAQAGSDAGNQEFVRDSGAGNGPATYTNYESAGTPAGSVSVASAGSSGTNANYQPYITVYMWKRVS
jgi:hypothetical protein